MIATILSLVAVHGFAVQGSSAANPPLWNLNRKFQPQALGREKISFSWTQIPWDESDTPWLQRRSELRAVIAQGRGTALLNNAWENANAEPFTSKKAFDLAFALIEVQPRKDHPAWNQVEFQRLAPARRMFIVAPMIHSYQYARMRFLVEARVESRSELVGSYVPLVKRLLARHAPDRAVSLGASYMLARSNRPSDVEFAYGLADAVVKTDPGNFWAWSNRSNALLFKWYRTRTEADRIAAFNAFTEVRGLAVSQGRSTTDVDECLHVLRKK